MALKEVCAALGVERVIWIDDVFGDRVVDLVALAIQQPGIQEDFPELKPAFAVEGIGDVGASLGQAIADLHEDRRGELRDALLQGDAEQAPAQELAPEKIDDACDKLGVAKDDRWSFQKAEEYLGSGIEDDETIAYVIDLKEGGGPEQRGLEILAGLSAQASEGVAFILTHEAAVDNEANKERELMEAMGPVAGLAPPLTVISKGRLQEDNADIEAALSISLKRAGLRRALFTVLNAATSRGSEALTQTARVLLGLEPERLEQYVYERGRIEGVSELSVVERALSAGASMAMRSFFSVDPTVRNAVQSLRGLQGISLGAKKLDAGTVLTGLRNSEIWESGDIINGALTPLANGDVFKFDPDEPQFQPSPKLFVLLGQPCDIMLRADGTRKSEMAMLVPLTAIQGEEVPLPDLNDPDEDEYDGAPPIPFLLNGKQLKLSVKRMTHVRLSILDLASFRTDGCVRVEAGHTPAATLLAGAKTIYGDRTGAADAALVGPMPAAPAAGVRPTIDDRLLLSMSDVEPWKRVRLGVRLASYTPPVGHHRPALAERVTWHLRREGRIRPPYSAFLLERALRTMGRRAFENDYTKVAAGNNDA